MTERAKVIDGHVGMESLVMPCAEALRLIDSRREPAHCLAERVPVIVKLQDGDPSH